MPRILSFNSSSDLEREAGKENFFKKLWESFSSFDKFTKIFILIIVVFMFVTPVITKQYFDTRQRAAGNKPVDQLNDSGKKQKPEYAKGEIIVKFRSSVNLELKESAKASGLSLDKNSVNVSDIKEQNTPRSLGEINKKYKLNKIEKVFKGATDPQSALNKIKQTHASEISQGKRKINEQELAKIDFSKTYKIYFDQNISVDQIVREFIQQPEVEYVIPNYIYKSQQISASPSSALSPTPSPGIFSPNDQYYLDSYPTQTGNRDPSWNPAYDYQWDLKKIGMEQVWNMTTNFTEVKVAVVDTGVDYTHPEFGGCTLDQVNNNQCQKVLPGFDFVNNDNDPIDDMGHGTHVAGIIAATANNGIGIAGMASNAKIIPVKGLDNQGSGYSDKLSEAIRYATDHGAKVINASWGGLGYDSLIADAISYAYFQGTVFVAAAGNEDNEADYFTPANVRCETSDNPDIDCVLTVAASGQNDQRAWFSNWGNGIDVSAPGGSDEPRGSYGSYNIISLKSSSSISDFSSLTLGTNYLRLAGTSMAAPHVAALAALILGKNSSLASFEVRNIIINGADDLGTPSWDVLYGYGRINAFKSLSNMDASSSPIAKISFPTQNFLTKGKVKIYGTASGTRFLNYKIEYSTDINSIQWSNSNVALENSGNQAVRDNLLGTVDLSGLSNGIYYIRLTVNASDNHKTSSMVSIRIDNAIRQNFPLEYTSTVLGASGEKPVIADINGDGKEEIIYQNAREAKLYAIEPDGSILSGWPVSTGERTDTLGMHPVLGSPIVANIDPQYQGLEVVVSVFKPYFGVIIKGFHADGTAVSGWTESDWQNRQGLNGTFNAISSININGEDSIIYLETGANFRPFGSNTMHVFTKSGQEMAGWPVELNGNYYSDRNNPVTVDIDKNGHQEIIINYQNKIRVYSDTGQLINEIVAADSNYRIINFTTGDMDNDGYPEIIATAALTPPQTNYIGKVYVWDHKGNLKSNKWPYSLSWTNFIYENPPFLNVGDFNNDGKAEILTSDGNNYYLLDVNANLLKGFPLKGFPLSAQRTNAIVNASLINNDHLLAFGGGLLAAYDYSFSSGSFTSSSGFPKDFGSLNIFSGGVGELAITDLDNDGKLEVVAPVELDNWGWVDKMRSYLYVFNLDDKASFLDWPQYLHDERHSGAYVAPPIPTPTATPVPTSIPTPTPTPFACTACAADIKKDFRNRVDSADYAVLASCFGKGLDYKLPDGTSCSVADINKDGLINNPDYQCLQSQYFKLCISASSATPTPFVFPTQTNATPLPTKVLLK